VNAQISFFSEKSKLGELEVPIEPSDKPEIEKVTIVLKPTDEDEVTKEFGPEDVGPGKNVLPEFEKKLPVPTDKITVIITKK